MLIKKGQWPILIINTIMMIFFAIYFSKKANMEFLMYIGVIIILFFVILLTNKRVNYPNGVLWGLTLWALLHMLGGAVYLNGTRLYEIILIPLFLLCQLS